MSEGQIRRNLLWAVPAFLVAGLVATVKVLFVKLGVESLPKFVSSCKQGGTFDCDKVQQSLESHVMDVPLAVWAIPTYFALLFLAWLALREDRTAEQRSSALDLLIVLSAGPVAYGLYLVGVQAKMGSWCKYCLVMDAAQLGTLVFAVLASPHGIVKSFSNGLRSLFGAGEALVGFVTVFGLTLGGALVWYHHEVDFYALQGKSAFRDELARCDQLKATAQYEMAVECYTGVSASKLTTAAEFTAIADAGGRDAIDRQMGFGAPMPAAPVVAPVAEAPAPVAPAPTAAPPVAAAPAPAPAAPVTQPRVQGTKTDLGYSWFEVPITPDDFVEGPMDAPVTLVEFADFECAYCKMLHDNLKAIRTKYQGKAKFIFKFYPMDGSCNPRMGGERMHPNACDAAKSAYCAGKQGKFWEAHDKLFSTQGQNELEKIKGYMGELGVDMSAWTTCMASDAPTNRIRGDVRLAAMAGLDSTPRTYINNRLMSGASSVAILDYYFQKALENPSMPAAAVKEVAATADMSPMVETKTQKGAFFIDRFEASIDKEGRAVSLAGVDASPASWFEAKGACEKAGKRLCTEEEWMSACTGTPNIDNNNNTWFNDDEIEGNRYPYGPFWQKGVCHDAQEALTGAPVKAGSKAGCRTDAGVYDLTGNFNEWIENDEKKNSLIGGSFSSGEGASCNRRGSMFGPGIKNNSTGFRCCADTMVANATSSPADLQAYAGDVVGRATPPFSIQTNDGKTVTADSLKGKVSYLTFFASWCGSCKRELPELKKWQDELGKKGFQVIAIGVDRYNKQSEDFISKFEPNYTVAFDPDSKSMSPFDISAMPTSFVVDKQGVVRRRIVGFKAEEVPGTRAFIDTLF